MNNLEYFTELVKEIKEHPGMFLIQPSVVSLTNYLNGFETASGTNFMWVKNNPSITACFGNAKTLDEACEQLIKHLQSLG